MRIHIDTEIPTQSGKMRYVIMNSERGKSLGLQKGRNANFRRMRKSKYLVNKCFLSPTEIMGTQRGILTSGLCENPPCLPYSLHIILSLSMGKAPFLGQDSI